MSINAKIEFEKQVPLSAQEQGHANDITKPVCRVKPTVQSLAITIVKRYELKKRVKKY